MNFFRKLTGWNLQADSKKKRQEKPNHQRNCRIEVLEDRRVLSADPVVAGITYQEGDSGSDSTPDHFVVTFEGGSSTTQLTEIKLNGDQDGNGSRSLGDMIFHANSTVPGAGDFHAFQFDVVGSQGITAADIESVTVSDDGLSLSIKVKNFEAGDKLSFTIDVDEVEKNSPDRIASGIEFETTGFEAVFVDAHNTFTARNVSIPGGQSGGLFWDQYDSAITFGNNLVSSNLDLPADDADNAPDRSAGAIAVYDLTPKPISISGTVFHDTNINNSQDSGELGISGVTLNLQKWNSTTSTYDDVASTQTDANGNYEFGESLGLQPGKYRIVEIQPTDFLSVGSQVGTVSGNTTGSAEDDSNSQPNILTEIEIPTGGLAAVDYDFAEVKQVSLSGHVYHDENDNGVMDAGEAGIANVEIRVRRTGGVGSGNDPFANSQFITVQTDANGFYQVNGLAPGEYEIVETNTYPAGTDPLANFLDGKDSVGNVSGQLRGTLGNDHLTGIVLNAGDNSVQNNFGEVKPVSISGFVSESDQDGNCTHPGNPNYQGIAGVTIQVLDQNGNLVAETQTDTNGEYSISGLRPGKYSIVEIQPSGFLDGSVIVGNVGGTSNGSTTEANKIADITLRSGQSGVQYGFCEHKPASIAGSVYEDLNNNGVQDAGEQGISGVTVSLLQADGSPVMVEGNGGTMVALQVTTDADGNYKFENLKAGNYQIQETQPAGYEDGIDTAGSLGGIVSNDNIREIMLKTGQNGVNYDFGELRPISISGYVSQANPDGTCSHPGQPGYTGIQGVTIELYDQSGSRIATTMTAADGSFKFEGLVPGTYTIKEIQPNGFRDGMETVGNVGGTTRGQLNSNADDTISQIILTSGEQAVGYGFCEHQDAAISGTVFHDRNNNGIQETGEEGISGATVRLLDANGNPIMIQSGQNMIALTATTDADGNYRFDGLAAGEYQVQEVQPADFQDGIDTLGSKGGQQSNDLFTKIVVIEGDNAINYNFGEFKLATIEGFTLVDSNGNCVIDHADDEGVSGVTIQLLDQAGNVVQTTTTDSNGFYRFADLLPGTYQVRQLQPSGYFTEDEKAGTEEGQSTVIGTTSENLISNIEVKSNFKLVQYNFCETPVAEISGIVFQDGPDFQTENGLVPANFLSQRDGNFTTDDQVISGVRMTLYWYVDPQSQSIAPRPVTLSEVDASFYPELAGNPDAPISVLTDANGFYSFKGLPAGNFIVLQEQPTGFVDSIDTAGSTTGQTFNTPSSAQTASGTLVNTLGTTRLQDAVVNIRVNAGQTSHSNNFSEVRAIPDEPETPQVPETPETPGAPPRPEIPTTGFGGLAGQQSVSRNVQIGIGFTAAPETSTAEYTWHLSVINGGNPRESFEGDMEPWQEVSFLSEAQWNQFQTDQGVWSFSSKGDLESYEFNGNEIRFGTAEGRPIIGDFNGDGRDEIGIFQNGYWLADLNGNGKWDDDDLMAQLGNADDQPVVGDWDGDGKDDIGIFGPIWKGDEQAIVRENGLPDRDNTSSTSPKNIPPTPEEAAEGSRVLKAGRRVQPTADVIDHVFGYGNASDTAFVADLNGDGIPTIGMFNGGQWRFDTNGDGKFNSSDANFQFGSAGDIPVVGDFDGDGVDEVAVYRNGKWIVDSNGNQELDASDKVFELKGEGIPMVGDFDGDGKDEPVFYNQQDFDDLRDAS